MLVAYVGVGIVGLVVWLLLRRAEKEADERSGTFFRAAKIVCVVLVFIAEFFLQTVLPQVGNDAMNREYGPPPDAPYGGDP